MQQNNVLFCNIALNFEENRISNFRISLHPSSQWKGLQYNSRSTHQGYKWRLHSSCVHAAFTGTTTHLCLLTVSVPPLPASQPVLHFTECGFLPEALRFLSSVQNRTYSISEAAYILNSANMHRGTSATVLFQKCLCSPSAMVAIGCQYWYHPSLVPCTVSIVFPVERATGQPAQQIEGPGWSHRVKQGRRKKDP